ERLYRALVQRAPAADLVWRELYRLLLLENRPAEAEQCLKDGFRSNPKKFDLLTMLAGHYLAQNRLDDLRRTVQEIKSYAAEFSGAWLAAGDLYLRAGDRDAAIREYREGAERDPKQSTFYLKR